MLLGSPLAVPITSRANRPINATRAIFELGVAEDLHVYVGCHCRMPPIVTMPHRNMHGDPGGHQDPPPETAGASLRAWGYGASAVIRPPFGHPFLVREAADVLIHFGGPVSPGLQGQGRCQVRWAAAGKASAGFPSASYVPRMREYAASIAQAAKQGSTSAGARAAEAGATQIP
jgi:hypothetical protein